MSESNQKKAFLKIEDESELELPFIVEASDLM